MAIQVYPQPSQGASATESAGFAWLGGVYLGDDLANDPFGLSVSYTAVTPATTVTVSPGIYEFNNASIAATSGVVIGATTSTNYSTAMPRVFTVATTSALRAWSNVRWADGVGATVGSTTTLISYSRLFNNVLMYTLSEQAGVGPTIWQNRLMFTTNGTTWSETTGATTNGTQLATEVLTAVGFVNGRYLAANATGRISYSTNLINWTTGSVITGTATNSVVAFAYNGTDRTVAVTGNGDHYLGTDGINWTLQYSASILGNNVKFVNGFFMSALGGAGINPPRIAHSTNGINWTMRTPAGMSSSNDRARDVAFGNGQYVVVSEFQNISMSTNLVNWTTSPNGYSGSSTNTYMLYSVEFIDGAFMALGSSTQSNNLKFFGSTDGVNWTNINNLMPNDSVYNSTTGVHFSITTIPSSSPLRNANYKWFILSANNAGGQYRFPYDANAFMSSANRYWSRTYKGRTSIAQTISVEKISNLSINVTTSL